MGVGEIPSAYFLTYRGCWGSLHVSADGCMGRILGIPEEDYPEGYTYFGMTPSEAFLDFLNAVYVFKLIEYRDAHLIDITPLSEEEIEEMYQKFLRRIREKQDTDE